MSAILDSRLDPERLAECERHDAVMHTGPMRAFVVRVDKGKPFEAMGRSSAAVAAQMMDLGQRVEVKPLTAVDRKLAEGFAGKPFELRSAS